MDAPPLVIEQVGEESDHVEQGQRDSRPQGADGQRQWNETQEGGRGGEVAEGSLWGVRWLSVRAKACLLYTSRCV